MSDGPQLLTANETAEVLRTTPDHVRGMARGGGLPHIRIGSRYLFPDEAINAWIREQTVYAPRYEALPGEPEQRPVARQTVKHRSRRPAASGSPKPLRIIGVGGQTLAPPDARERRQA